ncbi:class I SAM-dependent methyltransferase [Alkalicaulis satelles]|uniref:Class I SAM-dependent methyltransferase n=2 Tax=Alkalicaulis satelles TaxID=2609175 RepID=A0A5M6ZT72_9PROT|nr:class I SAM-dependent methyltransferase [Alkalicaulis satelles]
MTAHPSAMRADSAAIDSLKGVPRMTRFALRMLLKLRTGSLTVVLPEGTALRFDGAAPGPQARMEVLDYAIVRKVFAGGDVGFAESFMDGDWTTPDLPAVMTVFSANLDQMPSIATGGPLTRMINWIQHRLRANTKRGARKNIEAHYDLGNAFYSQWLDPSMTYSSARFTGADQSLEDAQHEKYAALARMIDLQPGHSVLEIGCGWGGFAEFAARDIGANVTCLTLSPSQRDYALERMQRHQLSERVEIKLQDYRDESGRYDRVASIEMFEAVGEEYWPGFFSKVADVLHPGGRAGLQIITIRDDLFERYARRADFIQRYIFPGGVLPSVAGLRNHFDRAGLAMDAMEQFGQDYARTLNIWLHNFRQAWRDIQPLGFDARFQRMWEFYFAYCEAGFRTERINVAQFALSKGAA